MRHVPRKKTGDLPSYEDDSKVQPQSEALYLHTGDLYHQEEDLAFESRQHLVASNEFEAFKQQQVIPHRDAAPGRAQQQD
jgi:hypothetical protein